MRIVLKEGLFDCPGRLRDQRESQEERKNTDGRHLHNGNTEISTSASPPSTPVCVLDADDTPQFFSYLVDGLQLVLNPAEQPLLAPDSLFDQERGALRATPKETGFDQHIQLFAAFGQFLYLSKLGW